MSDLREMIELPADDHASGFLIIGEVAHTHDCILGLANSLIDAIADSGSDA
jgi:sialic acid synthase SpsE